jgi:hypothetical protein
MNLKSLIALVILLAFAGPAMAAAPSTTGFQNQLHVMKATYSFATQGGTIGSYNLKGRDGTDAVLPSGAIIVKETIDITTAFTSTGGTGTIALTAQSAGDMLAAVDADTLSNQVTGIATGSGATGNIKLTANRTLSLAAATANLTAGALTAWVYYLY